MNASPTFCERQVRDMAEKVREVNKLVTKALRTMIPDPRRKVSWFTRAGCSTRRRFSPMKLYRPAPALAFWNQGPEVQILPLPLRTGRLTSVERRSG